MRGVSRFWIVSWWVFSSFLFFFSIGCIFYRGGVLGCGRCMEVQRVGCHLDVKCNACLRYCMRVWLEGQVMWFTKGEFWAQGIAYFGWKNGGQPVTEAVSEGPKLAVTCVLRIGSRGVVCIGCCLSFSSRTFKCPLRSSPTGNRPIFQHTMDVAIFGVGSTLGPVISRAC